MIWISQNAGLAVSSTVGTSGFGNEKGSERYVFTFQLRFGAR
tara:strand:- start:1219 stop:1344 length:126 start_codon:yes stop_codon:yes gene_type:complete